MSIKELLEQYNTVARGLGVGELKAWKGTTEKLQAKLQAMVDLAATRAANEAIAVKAPRAKIDKTARVTVKSIAEAAITAGKSNEEVLAAVLEVLPEAKTTLGCVRWYRTKMTGGK